MKYTIDQAARIMTLRGFRMNSERAQRLEQSALTKIARHPAYRELEALHQQLLQERRSSHAVSRAR